MAYRYETHCHTSECSACSAMPAIELIKFYKRAGYSGLCITDHFTGNSALPEDMPWADRVNFFFRSYDKARDAGKRHGLEIFFGIEYSIAPDINKMRTNTGNDFLILDPKKEWLLSNREAFTLKTTALLKKVRESGAFVIHAHPFNDKPWVEYIRLLPSSVDAVEIMNGTHSDFVNANAEAYAKAYGLLTTAGSDCHRPDIRVFGGVETDRPCRCAGDLIEAIHEKRARPFKEDAAFVKNS